MNLLLCQSVNHIADTSDDFGHTEIVALEGGITSIARYLYQVNINPALGLVGKVIDMNIQKICGCQS